MTPQKLLAVYKKGGITDTEAVNLLVKLAVDQDPVGFAADVPAEWLTELRELSCRTPPLRTFTFGSVCNAEPFDPEKWAAREKAEQERNAIGLRAWKAYFDATG